MKLKYSVIIPTMWRPENFVPFLQNLSSVDLISEILIIDNDPVSNPGLTSNDKIKLFNFNKNIKVNPSWNFGASISKENLLCFMNDDVTFNLNIFNFLLDKISDQGGMYLTDFYNKDSQFNLHRVFDRGYAQACLFFMHKNSYINIPEELQVYWGDALLFDFNSMRGKSNYLVTGCGMGGEIAKTSQHFSHAHNDEVYFYQNYKINNILIK